MAEITLIDERKVLSQLPVFHSVLKQALLDTPQTRAEQTRNRALDLSVVFASSVVVPEEAVLAEHIGGSDAALMGYQLGIANRQLGINDHGERIIGPITDVMEERRVRLRREAEEVARLAVLQSTAAIL
jgi:hypothetical protein